MPDFNKKLSKIKAALATLAKYQAVLPLLTKTNEELIIRIQELERENETISAQNKLFVERLNANNIRV